ncbi:hypothetical protein BJX65DRAFT_304333 [Aspergillus insuetus]
MADNLNPKEISSTTIFSIIWAEFACCTLVLALRVYSQFFIVRRPAADDFVMIGAWTLQLVASAISSVSAAWGLGTYFGALALEQRRNIAKFAFVFLPFGVFGPMLGRVSFILFIRSSVVVEVFHLRRWLLWALLVLQVVLNVVPVIMEFTQCFPVESLWDASEGEESCGEASSVQYYVYFQGAFNAFTDLILILIGVLVVIRLQLPLYTKIVLSVVLSFGVFAMAATILKSIQLRILRRHDMSYGYAMWNIWSLTEGAVVIMAASAPRLRAMLLVLRRKSGPSPYGHNRNSDGYEARRGDTRRPWDHGHTSDEILLETSPIVQQAANLDRTLAGDGSDRRWDPFTKSGDLSLHSLSGASAI